MVKKFFLFSLILAFVLIGFYGVNQYYKNKYESEQDVISKHQITVKENVFAINNINREQLELKEDRYSIKKDESTKELENKSIGDIVVINNEETGIPFVGKVSNKTEDSIDFVQPAINDLADKIDYRYQIEEVNQAYLDENTYFFTPYRVVKASEFEKTLEVANFNVPLFDEKASLSGKFNIEIKNMDFQLYFNERKKEFDFKFDYDADYTFDSHFVANLIDLNYGEKVYDVTRLTFFELQGIERKTAEFTLGYINFPGLNLAGDDVPVTIKIIAFFNSEGEIQVSLEANYSFTYNQNIVLEYLHKDGGWKEPVNNSSVVKSSFDFGIDAQGYMKNQVGVAAQLYFLSIPIMELEVGLENVDMIDASMDAEFDFLTNNAKFCASGESEFDLKLYLDYAFKLKITFDGFLIDTELVNIDKDARLVGLNLMNKEYSFATNYGYGNQSEICPYEDELLKGPEINFDGELVLGINQEISEDFIKADVTAYDKIDKDVTSSLKVIWNDELDIDALGAYFITYEATDHSGNKTYKNRAVQITDQTKPIITLKGPKEIILRRHEGEYLEAFATATDNIDGDISLDIVIENPLKTITDSYFTVNDPVGEYNVIYRVTDTAGNTAEAKRKVVVTDSYESGNDFHTAMNINNPNKMEVYNKLITETIYKTSTGSYVDKDYFRFMIDHAHTASVILDISHFPSEYNYDLYLYQEVDGEFIQIDSSIENYTVKDRITKVLDAGIYYIEVLSDTSYPTVKYATNDYAYKLTVSITNQQPTIQLDGGKLIEVAYGSNYQELGYSAEDNEDGDLTSHVIITGDQVDTSNLGSYEITYTVTDSSGQTHSDKRVVQVVDQLAPEVKLNGDSEIIIKRHQKYSELGVIATDNVDGDLSDHVVITSDLSITDTSLTVNDQVGNYEVTYTVVDKAGNTNSVSRKVIVVEQVENGNDFETATVISTKNETYYDTIYKSNKGSGYDKDYFKFESLSDQSINLKLEMPDFTSDYNYDLCLYREVESAIEKVSCSENTRTTSDHISRVISKGTYYIEVKSDLQYPTTVFASSEDFYYLTVSFDNSSPKIELIGGEIIEVDAYSTYTDPGFTAKDPEEGDITDSVIIGGDEINTEELGQYEVTYTITDTNGATYTIKRTVHVVDKTAPTLTLIGDAEIIIKKYHIYVELGATAKDLVDGDVSHEIIISYWNNQTSSSFYVNDNFGRYTITYEVTDEAGNTATLKRNLIVVNHTEEGNTFEYAYPINKLDKTYMNDTINDTIYKGYIDEDYYKFYLTGKHAVNITLEMPNFPNDYNYDLCLYQEVDGIPTKLKCSENNYTIKDTYSNDLYEGIYYIQVLSDHQYPTKYYANTELPYKLSVSLINLAPELTLKGDVEIEIGAGSTYNDPGYTAIDNEDGDISTHVMISGDVINTAILGQYEIIYTITDSGGRSVSKTRIVHVVDSAPVIILNGDSEIILRRHHAYEELYATAKDAVDGDISDQIIINNPFSITDTYKIVNEPLGVYKVDYQVTDSAGYTNVVSRMVIVTDPSENGNDFLSASTISGTKMDTWALIYKSKYSVDKDYYKFTLTSTKDVNISLVLSQFTSDYNYDLCLFREYNGAISEYSCSKNKYNAKDSIIKTLGPGTYYIEIKSDTSYPTKHFSSNTYQYNLKFNIYS